jgi:hypothetical protein
MKNITLLIVGVLLAISSSKGQQQKDNTNYMTSSVKSSYCLTRDDVYFNDTALTKEGYLTKSKSQKTIAWILLGVGTAVTVTGLYVALSDWVNNPGSDAGEILFFTGLASMAGSIPFFIISNNNKQKALQISAGLKMQENGQLIQMYAGRYQPAISIKLNLK